MKIRRHEGIPKLDRTKLTAEPLRIWLNRFDQLVIERGDELGKVARELQKRWPVTIEQARRIVALWFALGERTARKEHGRPWRPRELRADLKRCYLTGGTRS